MIERMFRLAPRSPGSRNIGGVPGSIGLRRLGPFLAVGLLLAAASVAAMLASPQIHRTPLTTGPRLGPAPDTSGQQQQTMPEAIPTTGDIRDVSTPGWLIVTIEVLCVVGVVMVVVLLVWYLLRNGLPLRERPSPPAPDEQPPPAVDEVIAAVDAGLSDLDDVDTDPRRAVIACWVRLEQAAAAAGTAREPGDTPAELVSRLLAGHDVSAPVLYALAEVYREARYATHTVDATMRDQARDALQQLRAQLAGQVAPA